MDSQNIILIKYGHFEKDCLDKVSNGIMREFNLTVVLKEGQIEVSEFYDAKRRQYDGNKLLKEVDFRYPGHRHKSIGLFQVDLFIPILTYIFGQAYLNGRTGIASLSRLKNERYGMKPDIKLHYNRFCKVVIHELGHTYGLKHCYNPICVMRASTYVEDLDQKKEFMCSQCKELLIESIAKVSLE